MSKPIISIEGMVTIGYEVTSQALKCSNLLMAERKEAEYEEYPYFLVGTAFCVRYDNDLWLFTAKHGVDRFKLEPTQLRFLPLNENREFLRPAELIRPRADHTDDIDHVDFLLFRIDHTILSETDIQRINPYSLSRTTAVRADDKRIFLFQLRGYPLEINSIDYDKKKIQIRAFESDAHFAGPDDAVHCYRLSYRPTCECADPNGLSGSPVFAALLVNDEIVPALTGMIIRGGIGANLFRMIGVEVLISSIEKAKK